MTVFMYMVDLTCQKGEFVRILYAYDCRRGLMFKYVVLVLQYGRLVEKKNVDNVDENNNLMKNLHLFCFLIKFIGHLFLLVMLLDSTQLQSY